jgi:hypothetical protein
VDASAISALAALLGAAIGGLTSVTAGWLTQRTQARAHWLGEEVLRRQDLYKDFIVDASQCYIHALQHGEPDIPGLVRLYGEIGRMRMLSSAEVLAAAEHTGRKIVETYLAPDKSFVELREMARNGSLDHFQTFSSAARAEFELLRGRQL